jgi:hypothetical protein
MQQRVIEKPNRILFPILIFLLLIMTSPQQDFLPQEIIASGELIVKGLSIQVDPPQQNVPINTPTIVNTIFSTETPEMSQGMVVKGELSGPGLFTPLTLTTLPNHPLSIPGLPLKGDYVLENIRIEKEGKMVLSAIPEKVEIHVMDVVVTSIETRPLTLEEIREKGIVFTDENFTAYNFSVGLMVESQEVIYDFPVVYSPSGIQILDTGTQGTASTGMGVAIGGGSTVPFILELPAMENVESDISSVEGGSIPGLLIFNNDIAFLNQFFSVMFIITNNAPEGDELTLKNLQATLELPEGLREAETNPPRLAGAPIQVKCPGPDGKIGTADDLDIIIATFSGMAEFLTEGLEEGTHIVKVNFTGTLSGLPSGDAEVKGSATGAVIVRNPEFSVTFSHPSVVRAGEEYNIYVTLTNTSPVAANLVSLTMPASRLIGTSILSEETVSFETIEPAESETAKFRMLSLETGRVRASAFAAEGNVTGKFVLTAGVGEQGIPLSPDTLTLPGYAYLLPEEITNTCLELLGQAYSIATTPAGALPEGLPIINKEFIKTRAIDLADAGQRIYYKETTLKSIEVLALDWLGSRTQDLPFDTLRRITSKGTKLAIEMSDLFNEDLKIDTPLDFQKRYAENCSYKTPYISAILSTNTSPRTAYLRITDQYQNMLSSQNTVLSRDIPYGEMYILEDASKNPVNLALIGHLDTNGYQYRIEVIGENNGEFDLSLILPYTNQGFQQVTFPGITCEMGSKSEITITSTSDTYTLSTDLNGDGTPDHTQQGTVEIIQEPQLQLMSATQDCGIHSAGHAVALLFNKDVKETTAKVKENFFVEGKEVYASYLQPSGRVVLVGLNNPVSPFVESKIIVQNLEDPRGNLMTPSPTEMPIISKITVPGGIVYGRAITAEGEPVKDAVVQLVEVDEKENPAMQITRSYTFTDLSGNYQFDYVRILHEPFTLEVLNPITKKTEKIKSMLSSNGQRYQIDIVMRGRGSVGGQVVTETGTPVPGALIGIKAEGSGMEEHFTTQSDENGSYMVTEVPLGRLNLFASEGTSYGSASTSLTIPGEMGNITIIIVIGKKASIKGRVLENDAITPVPGALIAIENDSMTLNTTKTADDGFFEFPSVPVGKIIVKAYNPNTGRLGGSVQSELTENQEFTPTIIFRGTGKILGTVLNFDGTPKSGVLVYIQNTNYFMNTDSNGEFVFENIPVGTSNLAAYNQTTQQMVYSTVTLNLEGQEVHTTMIFPSTQKGGISGKVYDHDGTTTIPYVNVYLCDFYSNVLAQTKTDGTGSYSFFDLNPGTHTVVSALTDKYGAVSNATIQFPGHYATCNLQFRGKGKVNVNVLASDGVTGVKANVEFSCSTFRFNPGSHIGFDGYTANVATDENGYLEYDNVLVGGFTVKASNSFYPQGASYIGKLTTPNTEVTVDLVMKPTGRIEGTIVSFDGITPVPNASVNLELYNLPEQQLYADENGTFIFTLIPPGSFAIEAEDQVNGYKNRIGGSMGDQGDTVNITVRLRGKGQVTGTVKNLQEAIIPNAKVTLTTIGYPHETFETRTNTEGVYNFYNVTESSFSIQALDDTTTYLGGRAGGTIQGQGEQVQVNVYLEPSGTIRGTVLGPDQQLAIHNAQVVLYLGTLPYPFGYLTTQADGTFEFINVPTGNFRVEVQDPVTGRKGKTSGTLSQEGETAEIEVYLEGRGTVTGTFFDGSETGPIPGAEVKIESIGKFPFNMVTTTDTNGNFSFSQIGQGEFELEATDPSTGLIGNTTGAIEYDEQVVYANIYAQGSGKVTGKVYKSDGITPEPLSRVEITSNGKLYTTIADSSGNYTIEYIPLGTITVKAAQQTGRDYGTATGNLENHGQEITVDITFKGLGTITGTVYDAGNIAQPNVNMNLISGYETFTTATNSEGEYQFDSIRMGPYTVVAKDPITGLSGTGSGELETDGQTDIKNITLESAGQVTGTILNSDGTTPADKAYVRLKGSDFTLYTTSNTSGGFQFDSVKLGTFAVEIEGYNNTGKAKDTGEVTSHGETVNLGTIILDDQIPEIQEIFPVIGSVEVPASTNISITFSKPMNPETINSYNIGIYSKHGQTHGTFALSGDQKTVFFTPSTPFYSFTLYTITISTNVEDQSGNAIRTALTGNFTTLDNTPPSVIVITPLNNATEVPTGKVIKVTFNECIQTTQFDTQNMTVTKSGVPITGTISFNDSGTEVFFTPQQLESNTEYAITIQGTQDFAGNTQTNPYNSTFTTLDTIAPTLQLAPLYGTATVKEGTMVTVEAIVDNPQDVERVIFYLDGVSKYAAKVAPHRYKFTAPLIEGTTNFSFLIEAVAIDYAGNQSPKEGLPFTLLPDASPQVTLTGPGSNTVYPGEIINCSVSVTDDVNLERVTLNATGGVLDYTDTQTFTQETTGFDKSYSIDIPVEILPGTIINIQTEAEDTRGNTTESINITLQVPMDSEDPQVQITSPQEGSRFKHNETISIQATATDDVGIKEVKFYLDEQLLFTDETPPYETTYTVPPLDQDSAAVFKVEAIDLSNKTTNHTVNVILEKLFDETAPVVKVTAPTTGSLVFAGENIKIKVTALDDEGIQQVEFYVDDQLLGTDTEAPYEIQHVIPFSSVENDSFTIKALAKDVDNKTTYDLSTITVVTGTFLPNGTIINTDNTAYDNQTIIIKEGIVEINGAHTFTNILVKETGTLTHKTATSIEVFNMDLTATGKCVVSESATINVSSKGYLGGYQGDNTTTTGRTLNNTTTGGSTNGSGGSYAGYGGKNSESPVNEPYGSLMEPTHPGSGGGAIMSSQPGSNGGGVVQVKANEIITDGIINANGGFSDYGSGSGGSIKLDSMIIKGSGIISANGGHSYLYGAGGGGRIAIYYENTNEINATTQVTAYGGTYTSGTNPDKNGGPGTILIKKKTEEGQVIIDNNGNESTSGTKLTGITAGTITALQPNQMTDANANFTPDNLKGMELIPNINNARSFTILSNTTTEIHTEPSDGDMTQVAQVGDTYRLKYPGTLLLEDANTTLTGTTHFSDVTLINTTFTVNGSLIANTLTLQDGSLITHSKCTTFTENTLYIKATDIIIDASSSIDVTHRGYLGGYQGDNNTGTGMTCGNTTVGGSAGYSGGSYGGYAGTNNSSYINEIYGYTYGPTEPGSGGSSLDNSKPGSNGGGVIQIETTELTNDGKILTNGGNSSYGAGSGGSIYIRATLLRGIGEIQANGGNCSTYGAGGGGRIAIYYENGQEFDFTKVTAYGGTYTGGTDTTKNATCGTIYLKKTGQAGELIIDNNGTVSYNSVLFPVIEANTITTITTNSITDENASFIHGSLKGMKLIPNINQPEQTFTILSNDSTTIHTDPNDGDLTTVATPGDTYSGIFVVPGHLKIINLKAYINRDLEVTDLSVINNGILRHSYCTSTITNYLSVKATGKILVDATSKMSMTNCGYLGGYSGDNSNFAGRTLGNTFTGGSTNCSGGSHAGYGGKNGTNPVNEVYGTLYDPSNPGSGGGTSWSYRPASNGGGVIRLTANELENNGIIQADGGGTGYGAGAGGSIKINVNNLKGTGEIHANGGNSSTYGAGGGGRVAVYYEDAALYDLTKITAYGGVYTGGTDLNKNGGAGTKYLKVKTQPNGELIIDNNNTNSRVNSTTLPSVGAGTNTLLQAQELQNTAATFIPGALKGIRLNPFPTGTTVFTITSNTSTSIFTYLNDGDMTATGQTGGPYIGEHHLLNLTIKGKAQVFTQDKVMITGDLTIETGSSLKAENH